MSTVSLTGSDTIVINSKVISDLADGDCVNMEFPNEMATLKTGKNGNVIYSLNETGQEATVVMRLIRGSSDDRFMNNLMAIQKQNFAGFVLLTGEFIKKIGDGEGNVRNDTYILSGGIFTKEIAAKNNTEGDVEQSISLYELKFSKAPRVIS